MLLWDSRRGTMWIRAASSAHILVSKFTLLAPLQWSVIVTNQTEFQTLEVTYSKKSR